MIDTHIGEYLEKNGEAIITPVGISMWPMIRSRRDTVLLTKPQGRLCKYDLPVYKRESGELVMHRVMEVCSNSYTMCGDHQTVLEYGITDEQIVALAKKGGVMQICIYDHFLNNDGVASVKTIADHIDHVVNLVGVDYVGIGTDFDGGGGVPGCNGANEIINLTCELIRRGYGDGDLKKIWGENFLRVLDEVKKVANF